MDKDIKQENKDLNVENCSDADNKASQVSSVVESETSKNALTLKIAGIIGATVVLVAIIIGVSSVMIFNSMKQQPPSEVELATEAADKDIRPDFKAAMDKREKVRNQYIELTEKYKGREGDPEAIEAMSKWSAENVRVMDEMNKIDFSKITAEEEAYRIEVEGRIARRAAEASKESKQ